jgi:hypothetical protein
MKKYSYYFLLICMSYYCNTNTTYERVRPIQYSSLSGRMIYVPHPRVRAQQPSVVQENLSKRKAVEVLEEEKRLAEAEDRNERMRKWQLQRSTRSMGNNRRMGRS